MKDSFDTVEYTKRLGEELLANFTNAGATTTPGLIGSAREHATRRKFEHLLPGGIAVGTGCIIDSYGGVSRQIDIVLYEKHLCPVFSVNEDPNATYFPCEGVIAVGEVKSHMGSQEMRDSFEKIASVKRLRRHAQLDSDGSAREFGFEPTLVFRSYGSRDSVSGVKEEQFDQEGKPYDQIFGFSFTGSFRLKARTVCTEFAKLVKEYGSTKSPNLMAALNDNRIVKPLRETSDGKAKMVHSAAEADRICCGIPRENAFQFLLSTIYDSYRRGRTVDEIAFGRYFAYDQRLTLRFGDGVAALE